MSLRLFLRKKCARKFEEGRREEKVLSISLNCLVSVALLNISWDFEYEV